MLHPDQLVLIIPQAICSRSTSQVIVIGERLSAEHIKLILSSLTPTRILPTSVQYLDDLEKPPLFSGDNALVVTSHKVSLKMFDAPRWRSFILEAIMHGKIQIVPLSFFVPLYQRGTHLALQRPYGTVLFRGEPGQVSVTIESTNVLPSGNSSFDIWPIAEEDRTFFKRRTLPDLEEHITDSKGVVVAKEIALPHDWTLQRASGVCVPGLESWRKLSARGIWINFCFDGLGETEPLSPLFQHHEWIKLTHDYVGEESRFTKYATYSLTRGRFSHDLSQKRFFYWRSGSLFREALKQFPSICSAHHSCGVGNTYQAISRILENPMIPVFLTHHEWRNQFQSVMTLEVSA